MANRPSDSVEQPGDTPVAPSQDPETVDKIEHPQTHFDHPGEVVIDPQLSKDEKLQVLGEMEQDARQLSAAAAEGMTGGQGGSGLPDVLAAKDALELPPFDRAVSVVLQSLRAKLQSTPEGETRLLITRAIEAVEAAGLAVASADAGR